MKSPYVLRLSLLLVGLATATPVLSAAPGPAGSASDSTSATEVKSSRVTLDIRKGQIMEGDKKIGTASVGGILDYLRKKNDDFTIALGPGVADVVVGDMILNMEPFNNYAVGQAIAISASEPLVFNTDFPALVLKDQQQRQVAVFNLSSYLNPNGDADEKSINTKLDSLTQIILHTLEDVNPIDPGGKRLSFQFHAGANLLVVTGTEQAIKVAGQVVNALVPQGLLDRAYAIAAMPKSWANPYSNAAPQLARSLSESSLDDAQMQAVMNALKRAQNQSSQAPEQAKTAQQRAEEIQKLVQEWSQSDPAAAAQWMQSLPKPPPPPPPAPMFSPPAGSAK